MVEIKEWALLAYRMPREPSTPRIGVWRKLRRLGAVQLVDGLVALPLTGRNREQLDWIADEVLEAGGEAWTFTAQAGSKAQHKALVTRVGEAAAEEYKALIEEVGFTDPSAWRTVDRLERELAAIEARDPVGPKERDKARRAVAKLREGS